MFTVPDLKLDWDSLLSDKYKLWQKYKYALLKFYYSPNHEGSCTDVAKEFNDTPSSLNALIMNFGRAVQKAVGTFTVMKDNEIKYWPILMDGYYNENHHFVWRLKPELVETIRKNQERDAKLKDKFLEHFPLNSLRKMTISQYFNQNREDSFCYLLEFRTRVLGSIKGGSSLKFGIYQYEQIPKENMPAVHDDKYCWLAKYNCDTSEEAFNVVREKVVTIAEKASEGDLEGVDAVDFGDAVKWKIACLYSDNKVINMYTKELLQAAAKGLGFKGDLNSRPEMNEFITSQYDENRESFFDFYWRVGLHYFGKTDPERIYWLAGYSFGSIKSQLGRFIKEGIWESKHDDGNSSDQKLLPLAQSISEGDVIILKSTSTKGTNHDQPFMRVKAIGVVTSNIETIKIENSTFCRCSVNYVSTDEKDFDGAVYGSYRKTLHQSDSKLKDVIDYVNSLIPNEDMPSQEIKIEQPMKYNEYIELLIENHNLVLTGAPGTGKTYMAQVIAKEMGAETKFVQFHPSYDYTDFVEGLRPVEKEDGQMGFERKDGVFKQFCREAINDASIPYVFIIDEINRGEASKIFGELFFAIDPGYRGMNDNLVQTQYQNLVPETDVFAKGFYVPENVYILATMNDIDRSVESMDFAMRRRFTWKEVTPANTESMLDTLTCASEAKATMTRLNEAIAETEGLGFAYQIGPSYFLKLEKNGGNLDKLWEMNIQPLLKEYLRGFRKTSEILDKFKAAYFGAKEETATVNENLIDED